MLSNSTTVQRTIHITGMCTCVNLMIINKCLCTHEFAEQHGVPLKNIEAVDRTKLPKMQKRQGSKR